MTTDLATSDIFHFAGISSGTASFCRREAREIADRSVTFAGRRLQSSKRASPEKI